MGLGNRLDDFVPERAYKPRTIEQLNNLASKLNEVKDALSGSIQVYLDRYKNVPRFYDIPRLCRALATPDRLALETIQKYPDMVEKRKIGSRKILDISRRISRVLGESFAYSDELNYKQRAAIVADKRELKIYMNMYNDINMVTIFPKNNPFEDIMDMMEMGAVIGRFKYVSRGGSEPQEKFVTYHPMNSESSGTLAVHVQGDDKFSMSKKWGWGDEAMSALYDEFEGTVVRWSRESVIDRLNHAEGSDMETKETLY